MSITIRELLDTPHLGLYLVAGEAGIDHDVTWAHVSELEDPAPWLEGGELVLTAGIGVPSEPQEQRAYIRRMAEARVCGVGVSRDLLAPPLTEEMKDEANRRAFPLLEVSIEVPFVAIARAVAAAVQGGAQRRLLTHIRIFDTLRATTIEGLGPGELFRRLEDLSGFHLYLATPTGRPLIEGVPPPPPELAAAHLPREPGRSPWIPDGFVVSIPLAGRTAGYLFATERPDGEPAGVTAAQHIATVAALELANRSREQEVLRREGAETLAELLAGALDAHAAATRLKLARLDPTRALLLLAIDGAEEHSSLLQDAWGEIRLPHLLLHQRELYALLSDDREGLRVVEQMEVLRIGASRPFHLESGFATPRREALWSLQRATERGEALVRFPQAEEGATWLPADAAVLRELVAKVLGPILDHDRSRKTELLRSLRVWLEQDRRTERAARQLGVHEHTLQYRLRRIEQLTGRRLTRVQDMVDVWLAIRAHELVGADA